MLALTDHDTLAGIDEATVAIRGTGMTLVPGIELSAQVIDPRTRRHSAQRSRAGFVGGCA